MSLLTKDEIQVTLSKAHYWREIEKRDQRDFHSELHDEVKRLGTKTILFVLAAYAEAFKNEE